MKSRSVSSRFPDITPELVVQLHGLTTSAFEIIGHAWKQQGGVYVDFKIECGFDRETGESLIADVIEVTLPSGQLRRHNPFR